MRVLLRVKLCWGDSRYANFFDEEVAELEVARPVGDLRGKGVVRRESDGAEVGEDEVSAFGIGVLRGVSRRRERCGELFYYVATGRLESGEAYRNT